MSLRLGKYELIGKLGEGGFGEVWRARDTGLGREVAIKIFKSEYGQSPEFIEHFRREARLSVMLDHPNIVTIYDTGVHESFFYIVMRYYPGGSLAARIKNGRLPFAQALAIINQVCAGLEKLHAQGGAHRDLKPSNILFDTDGCAVVVDFGLARAAGQGRSPSPSFDAPSTSINLKLGDAQYISGTPAYMAPEQWRPTRAGEVGPRSDVYALGCIFAEMLTGYPLFKGEDTLEVGINHMSATPDYGPGWPPAGVPAWATALIARMLDKDPARRPASAGKLLAILEREKGKGGGIPKRGWVGIGALGLLTLVIVLMLLLRPGLNGPAMTAVSTQAPLWTNSSTPTPLPTVVVPTQVLLSANSSTPKPLPTVITFTQTPKPVGSPTQSSAFETLQAASFPTPTRPASYTLEQGDHYVCIARRYNLNLDEFFALNGLNVNSQPVPGTKLKIPVGGVWSSAHGPRGLKQLPITYTVAADDNVNRIACSFGNVFPEEILIANSLTSSKELIPGMEIWIP